MSKYSVGDVVELKLDPVQGQEKGKTRPCLVIFQHPKLDLITVLPVTDASGKKGAAFVTVKNLAAAGLSKDSVIDTLQIRTLSSGRITKALGKVSKSELFLCRKSLALIFEIDEVHL
ncbi:type II toxin-antitoxin system PemK/MazF family toxin [Bdellovibrio bacteriovorus]|uniref:type II toxin-antitoxin system PemK/MazF family toxin n=1 Tax=Bdellovibrio bacteriovorus TaxID=959 RepID=UPI0012F7E836|nr:type II toxin-antitoxin system PemK/MazF family toxin [Bdellovibrio bacteriovorus]